MVQWLNIKSRDPLQDSNSDFVGFLSNLLDKV